ncbi:MAG: VTT domain-containing protein [Buchananella hordeovulneris]|nr:VTT domain-containing protein [Buchananella hordeovulneris]
MHWLEAALLNLGATPWAMVALYFLCVVDGVFPAVPSESMVIGFAVLHASHGFPSLWVLFLVAAVGAFTGDVVVYHLGRKIPLERVWFMRGPRGQAAIEYAQKALAKRGTLYILSARFVPIGRVAVNLISGATGFPRKRFISTALLAGFVWAAVGILIGSGVGAFLHDYPLVGIAVGIVVGVFVGMLVDKLVAWLGGVFAKRGEPAEQRSVAAQAVIDVAQAVAEQPTRLESVRALRKARTQRRSSSGNSRRRSGHKRSR